MKEAKVYHRHCEAAGRGSPCNNRHKLDCRATLAMTDLNLAKLRGHNSIETLAMAWESAEVYRIPTVTARPAAAAVHVNQSYTAGLPRFARNDSVKEAKVYHRHCEAAGRGSPCFSHRCAKLDCRALLAMTL